MKWVLAISLTMCSAVDVATTHTSSDSTLDFKSSFKQLFCYRNHSSLSRPTQFLIETQASPSPSIVAEAKEIFQEKLNQASQNGCAAPYDATGLNMWVQFVGGKNRGRLYGAGDRASLYRPGIASLTPDYRPSRGCTQVPSQYSIEMAAHMATVEERAKTAEDEARQTWEEL